MMTLPPWSTGRFAGAFEARTVRLRSMRTAEAARAANTRLGGAIPYFPGGLQHQESRSCYYSPDRHVPIIGTDNTNPGIEDADSNRDQDDALDGDHTDAAVSGPSPTRISY